MNVSCHGIGLYCDIKSETKREEDEKMKRFFYLSLLIVAMLKRGGGKAALKHIYDVLNGKSVHNGRLAEMAYRQACKLAFMSDT